MACQILVSNKSGMPTGEIITIQPIDFTFSKNETFSEWVKKGENPEAWSRLFSLVIVTDKSMSELQYLNDSYSDTVKKWLFTVPERGSIEFQELYETGEIKRNYSDVLPYLKERR